MSSLATISVAFTVTVGAQCDQILGAVMPKLASPLDVMNLQIFECAAVLATPIVPGKNLLAKSFVRVAIQSEPWLFWPQARHNGPLISCRNWFRCSSGNNL